MLKSISLLSLSSTAERVLNVSLAVDQKRENKKLNCFFSLGPLSLSLLPPSSPAEMASAPATGSAATKEAIKRVLVVIGERLDEGLWGKAIGQIK